MSELTMKSRARTGAEQASRAVGQSVTGLVDLLAMGLRPLGYNVPDDQVIGSTKWAEKAGLLAQEDLSAMGIAGQAVGMAVPTSIMARAPQVARGLLAAADNAAAPATIQRGGQRGMILFHGSQQPDPLRQIEPGGGTFGGLFASRDKKTAASHGDALYRMTVPDDKVLTQAALNNDLHERARSVARNVARERVNGGNVTDIAEMIVSGRGAFNSTVPEQTLLKALGEKDLGAADWELQRLRGEMSKRLGFHAVEMYDEHGVSHLVTGGAKPRPANDAARKLFRPPRTKQETAVQEPVRPLVERPRRQYVTEDELPSGIRPGRTAARLGFVYDEKEGRYFRK